jgi:penicillin-binding protein 1A
LWLITIAAVLFIVLPVAFFAGLGWLVANTPASERLQQVRVPQPTVLLAADGTPFARFRLVQQEGVTLDQVSPWVVKALIATEDRRFYQHSGVDVSRTLSATLHTASGEAQGGSTITQQLVRNAFPEEIGRSRTLVRKLKEIVTAMKVERDYSKDKILELYLNTMPFLYNVYGIEMAAHTYFDKRASQLDPAEAATLVGMLKGTYYYNPVVNPERARVRRDLVLSLMEKQGMLSAAQRAHWQRQPLQVRFNRPSDVPETAPHFTEYVRKWLVQWAEQNDRNLYSDGLVVQTTLDLKLQEAAMRAVERETAGLQAVADVEWGQPRLVNYGSSPAAYVRQRDKVEPFRHFWSSQTDLVDAFVRESTEFRKLVANGEPEAKALAALKKDNDFMRRLKADKTRLEAGFVALEPSTGKVRAWVGSRDFLRDRYDHVAQAERQPGSTFKPFVYGAALERGVPPDRVYFDNPVTIRLSDGRYWTPNDMTGSTGQPMTLRDGLVYSKNSITAQVMQDAGVQSIVSFARTAGVTQSKLDPVPSLALGTSPVTLLEMASGYATIAGLGNYRRPVFVERITDRQGQMLAQFASEASRAVSQETAVQLIDMMRGVVDHGTGTAVRSRFGLYGLDIAGKTGTTQNNTDGWFIVMHPGLVAGAWVGFNDSRLTMRSSYWGQGGHNAILLVGDFLKEVTAAKLLNAKAQFPKPPPPSSITIVESVPGAPPQAAGTAPPPAPGSAPAAVVPREPGRAPPYSPPLDFTRQNITGASLEQPPHGLDGAPPRSAEEVARLLRAMGRDPITGETATAGSPPGTRYEPPPPPPRHDTLRSW